MKFYLAARFSRNPEMRGYRDQLVAIGHTVTSRWIDGLHETKGSDDAAYTTEELGVFAREDLEDVFAADVMIAFTEQPRVPLASRGGRHVEFGAAIAAKKNLVVIGPRENVFHSLSEVTQFDTFDEFLSWMGWT